jgi:hypothetical protein
MTPKQQIRAARQILKPGSEDEIKYALAEIDAQERHAKPLSKRQRLVTARLLNALRRSAALAAELSKVDAYWALFPIAPAAIARLERTLRKPSAAKHRAADRQKLAVAHARILISEFGDEKDLAVSRDNGWHQLSAILYGDESVDLFRHMRDLKSELRLVFRPELGRK